MSFGTLRLYMLARIKIIIRTFVTVIQKTVVTISLFLIYVFGFGLTIISILLFNRDILITRRDKKDGFWVGAKDYEADMERSLRQS